MATREILATNTWQRVTDGTSDAVIQFWGVIELCDSTETPAENTAALRFDSQTLTISPPTKAWVRAAWSGVSVSVVIL